MSGGRKRKLRVSPVPCGAKAECSGDRLLSPEQAIASLAHLTKCAINNETLGNYSRPMPASVVAILKRHLDELAMAEGSMRYESSRAAVIVMAGRAKRA